MFERFVADPVFQLIGQTNEPDAQPLLNDVAWEKV